MATETRDRILSIAGTLLFAIVLVLVLVFTNVTSKAEAPLGVQQSEIVLDDEFVEIEDYTDSSTYAGEETPRADAEENINDVTGVNTEEGSASDREVETNASRQPVTSNQPSDIKEETRRNPGNTNTREDEERRQRQELDNEMAGAFGNNSQQSTAQQSASRDRADGIDPNGTHTGTSLGTIGNGWGMPNFNGVVSNVTGRVVVEAQIDGNGRVTSVTSRPSARIHGVQYNAEAPAGTDATVINACCNQVRSRTFTRTGINDGNGTMAIIVFTFR